MKNRLSIGVPAYNQGAYLRETILSLLQQSDRPYEIVVSNNHSTDETTDVIAEFKNEIRAIAPPNHLSMSDHWNFVANQLEGEWISLLSSDDRALPNFTRDLLRGATRSKKTVLVRCAFQTIDADSKVVSTKYIHSVKKICSPPLTFMEQLCGPKVSFAAFAVRRNSFIDAGGFPNLKLYADWGLWLKLAMKGDFVYEPEIISQYRINYRPFIDKKRLFAEIDDEIAIFKEIIPGIIKEEVGVSQNVVEYSLNKRIEQRLAYISRLLDASDVASRKTVAEKYDILLRENSENRSIERLLDGHSWNYNDIKTRVKAILRPVLDYCYKKAIKI